MPDGTSLSLSQSASGANRLLQRWVVTTVTLWPLLAIYMIINRHQPGAPEVVAMPTWVPFWPAFAPPYFAVLLATGLLPVAIADPARFRVCLLVMVVAHLAVMPVWIIHPTTLPRPPMPTEWWAAPYRWIAAHDLPNNIMPCAHGIGPLMAAWSVGRERPSWRWPLAALLAVGLPSIILIWQHRPIDVVMGIMVAMLGILMGEILLRNSVKRSHPS